MKLKATLRLENGMEFHGYSFGCEKPTGGEVVFNTSMVGYPEQLTDPTYNQQILCLADVFQRAQNNGDGDKDRQQVCHSLHRANTVFTQQPCQWE